MPWNPNRLFFIFGNFDLANGEKRGISFGLPNRHAINATFLPMAIASGMELPLAGLIGCSAYPHPNWHPPRESPPVFLFHGDQDEVVPIQASQKILMNLKNNKLEANLFKFRGGHEIPQEVIQEINLVLKKCYF